MDPPTPVVEGGGAEPPATSAAGKAGGDSGGDGGDSSVVGSVSEREAPTSDFDGGRSDVSPRMLDSRAASSPDGRFVIQAGATRLGSGAFKTVFLATDTKENVQVAWNNVDISSLGASNKVQSEKLETVLEEVQLLKQLDHPRVLTYIASWQTAGSFVFITDLATEGTLRAWLGRHDDVKMKVVKHYCRQILEALVYLHSRSPPVIHRDLKCDNILLNGETGDIILSDFGLATIMTGRLSVLGTPNFMAPELFDGDYDERVDVYSFGMVLLEMVTGRIPYDECEFPTQIWKKVSGGVLPDALKDVKDPQTKEFILLCVSRHRPSEPGKRPSAAALLKHTFLVVDAAHDEDTPLAKVGEEGIAKKVQEEIAAERVAQLLSHLDDENYDTKDGGGSAVQLGRTASDSQINLFSEKGDADDDGSNAGEWRQPTESSGGADTPVKAKLRASKRHDSRASPHDRRDAHHSGRRSGGSHPHSGSHRRNGRPRAATTGTPQTSSSLGSNSKGSLRDPPSFRSEGHRRSRLEESGLLQGGVRFQGSGSRLGRRRGSSENINVRPTLKVSFKIHYVRPPSALNDKPMRRTIRFVYEVGVDTPLGVAKQAAKEGHIEEKQVEQVAKHIRSHVARMLIVSPPSEVLVLTKEESTTGVLPTERIAGPTCKPTKSPRVPVPSPLASHSEMGTIDESAVLPSPSGSGGDVSLTLNAVAETGVSLIVATEPTSDDSGGEGRGTAVPRTADSVTVPVGVSTSGPILAVQQLQVGLSAVQVSAAYDTSPKLEAAEKKLIDMKRMEDERRREAEAELAAQERVVQQAKRTESQRRTATQREI